MHIGTWSGSIQINEENKRPKRNTYWVVLRHLPDFLLFANDARTGIVVKRTRDKKGRSSFM